MDYTTVQAIVLQEVEEITNSALCKEHSWRMKVEDLVLFVWMHRRGVAETSYLLKVELDDYPRRAPSFVFVDTSTRLCIDQAWPPSVKHNHAQPGMCIPGTRECHEVYHANEPQHRWDPAKTPLFNTLARIQQLMDPPS